MATKYQELLKDDDVRRWYENLAAKSTLTASVYLRGLRLFCSLNDTSPKRILQEAKKKPSDMSKLDGRGPSRRNMYSIELSYSVFQI